MRTSRLNRIDLLLSVAVVLFLTVPRTCVAQGAPDDLRSGLDAAGLASLETKFGPFRLLKFELEGVESMIAVPDSPAAGRPWVWRARFWGHQPQLDLALLELGWYVCYCDVADLFGADAAVERWDAFYRQTQQLGLSPRPLLEAMSRGGLIAMRWASRHPEQVSGIYLDNAVLDFSSWPGGMGTGRGAPAAWSKCLKAYGLSSAQASRYASGPLDNLQPLAQRKVPVFVLINEADEVVPPAENGDRLVAKYRELGGQLTEMRRAGLGHHPHSLRDPTPLVDFALAAHKRWQ